MTIHEVLEKIKPFYMLLLVAVLGVIFFFLGRLSALHKADNGIAIDYSGAIPQSSQVAAVVAATSSTGSTLVSSTSVKTTAPAPSGEVIGSKSGKKYYFPWCGTVKRIKPENQVHFPSIEAAKAAGFTPGGNCKGLQ